VTAEAIARRGPVGFLLAALVLVPLLASCSGDSTDRYPRSTVTLPPATTSSTTAETSSTTVPTTTEQGEIIVSPANDLAGLVDASQPGTAFLLTPGIHRTSTVVPKDDMTFAGMDGAVMSGALPLDGFAPDGEMWSLDGVTLSTDARGECIPGYASCGLPNDLFIDGVMLWRVDTLEEVEPGSWWGGDGRVVVADDPTGRIVEMSVESYAFVGSASGVTIRDLVVEKYATPSQEGAIQAEGPGNGEQGRDWRIEDVEARYNHAVGIKTGDRTVVSRVHSHHNGQLGIAVSGGTDVLISDSEFDSNNTRGYLWEWEGGGGKFTRTNGLVVRGTFSHDNLGPGLWTDIDAVDTTYEGNTVTDNLGPGIFHEISGAAVIRDNDVSGNGFGKSEWAWGGGILIAASFDVEVTGNRVYDNADGIVGIQQERGEGPLGVRWLARLDIHDNEVRQPSGTIGIVHDVGDVFVIEERDIRFRANRYLAVDGRRAYAWDGAEYDKDGWIALGQDVDGTWE
jgi:parallel beta-helix repeat protein